jgi:hypothetical protein
LNVHDSMSKELQLGLVYFSYGDLPKEWRKKLSKEVKQRHCSHCHKKTDGYVRRRKVLLTQTSEHGKKEIRAVPHLPACEKEESRACKGIDSCNYPEGHKEVKAQQKREKDEKLAAKKKQREEETIKKHEVAKENQHKRNEASIQKSLNKAKKLASRLRNGDVNKFVQAVGVKDNAVTALNQAVACSNLFTTIRVLGETPTTDWLCSLDGCCRG